MFASWLFNVSHVYVLLTMIINLILFHEGKTQMYWKQCNRVQTTFLKPMDSFGTCMTKMKIYIFALLMQNFIELYELLMPC